jgi:murein DD-endopeptidase MepM/ murein hydrolase activator NlpD
MKTIFLAIVLSGLAFISNAYITVTGSSVFTSSENVKELVFPVAGKKSNIGSFWGDARDGGKRKHKGIDIFAKKGTPVVAVTDGIIVSKGNTPRGGKHLWLQSIHHPWKAYYAHLDQQKAKAGQIVKKGEIIGTVGNTGNAKYTPSHLHFGIYKWWSGAVDPLPFVKNSPKISLSPVTKTNTISQPVVKK